MTNGGQSAIDLAREEREKEADTKTKEANAKKANAEAEKAETEAQQAKLKAQTPSGESKPVEGKTTADNKAGYAATLAAYNSMIQKAADIAIIIDGLSLTDAHQRLVDSLNFCSSDVQLLQVSAQINFWVNDLKVMAEKIENFINKIQALITGRTYNKGIVKSTASVIGLSKGLLSSVADIVGFFRVDYEIKGQEINLSLAALQALVAGRIKKYSVYLPGFYRILSYEQIGVVKDFNQCVNDKNRLKVKITELKELLNNVQVEKKKKDGTPEEKTGIVQAGNAYEQAENLIKEFVEFNKSLTSVPQGGGNSPLVGAAVRQCLDTLGITHLLYLNVTSSGGEMVIGKGIFQWGHVGYLGGCVITYLLAECSGKILAADSIFGYSRVKYHLWSNILSPFKSPKPVKPGQ